MLRKLGALGVLALVGCGGIDVRGFVRDEDTGEPLPGATVRVGDDEVQSDSGGFYELEVDDDDETRRVYVSKEGYEATSDKLEVDDDDEEIHKDLRMQKQQNR